MVEATWFGYYEPYVAHPLSSYIYDMMTGRNQLEMAEELGLLPFQVNVLQPVKNSF